MSRYFWTALWVMLVAAPVARAEEGMWIPLLIRQYPIGPMKEAGFKLEAEDIYSINRDCLKDAVVLFGRGCTGSMISGDGLLLTNHHCGLSQIQYYSAPGRDYLAEGFWAMNREEELPGHDLSVSFLRYMEDVTGRVNEGLEQGMDPQERKWKREENQTRIIREAISGTHYEAEVKSFYYGNAYYLFVYERYTDVRLVAAPPGSVGRFGGDTDNWMWPRHSGDFSLFRVYADQENNPADYSPGNRPYIPRRHLEISAGGISEGDFTMILGYPASTSSYLYSGALRILTGISLPLKIDLRSRRLEIMERYMKTSDRVRIQYTSKQSRLSNAWKLWQGVILGMEKGHEVERREDRESAFRQWVNSDGMRMMKYDRVPDEFKSLYDSMETYSVAAALMDEAILPVEVFRQLETTRNMMYMGLPAERIEQETELFFKDFYLPVDRDIFAAMMEAYREKMPADLHPAFFTEVEKKYRGDLAAFAASVFGSSVFGDREPAMELISKYKRDHVAAIEELEEDPIARLLDQFRHLYMLRITPAYGALLDQEEELYRIYMAGLLEMSGDRPLFPDANRTMRLSFGTVAGYEPRDGVEYECSTTLAGLMEKFGTGESDYTVPVKLRDLYLRGDYGRYGVNGTMPVCFIASSHTSGGNSGSPVLDAEGRLVGLNFDKEWEGTMSDYCYDPDLCRNIAVDIRYILFIIDKFAGAGYLLQEMDITW
jgi:hypothetical protein